MNHHVSKLLVSALQPATERDGSKLLVSALQSATRRETSPVCGPKQLALCQSAHPSRFEELISLKHFHRQGSTNTESFSKPQSLEHGLVGFGRAFDLDGLGTSNKQAPS